MRLLICAGVIAACGVALAAQNKITTMEEYAKLMKANGQANGALNKAIGSGAFADARTQVATLRQNFVTLQPFWEERKREDAVAVIKEGLTRLAALDKMLAATPVDQAMAAAAAKELGPNACGACHKVYREGDAEKGFSFRPGVF